MSNYTQQDLLDALYDALKNLGADVYMEITGPNPKAPYIIVNIIGDVLGLYFPHTDDFRTAIQVTCYDLRHGSPALPEGIKRLRVLGERVKSALHRNWLNVANAGGVNGWCTRRGTPQIEEDWNSIRNEFIFVGSEV